MALIAMTTSDTVDYVSDLDPSKKRVKKPGKSSEAGGEAPDVEEVVIEEGATTFKIRGLDVFLMGYVYDNASTLSGKQGSDDVGIHTRMNQTNIECVRHGLTGFTNFANAKADQVVFKTQKHVVNGRPYDVVADAIMNMLGVRLVQELASQIKKISEVSKAEEKNSAGA